MSSDGALPEGIFSLLDTDLYKLTMQSAVLKYFPQVPVTYRLTNRTPGMKLNRLAFNWLQQQINKLEHLKVTTDELSFLRKECPFLSEPYLHFLQNFELRPREHVKVHFRVDKDTGSNQDLGDIEIDTEGLWVDTILYEIPMLALTSEAYFKFMDRDWKYEGQLEKAKQKGMKLTEAGCMVMEFGSRRRRDYHTHDLIVQGLLQANAEAVGKGHRGKIVGTSNVHLAMKHGVKPLGTIAHEWFMGVAAVTDSYMSATETALAYWIGTFGKGVLAVALTDTFGTEFFLKAFERRVPAFAVADKGAATTLASSLGPAQDGAHHLSSTDPPITHNEGITNGHTQLQQETYAEAFTGVRQDSGDPLEFVKTMKAFYDKHPPKTKKTITFSDSLNVEKCIEYKKAAEDAGLNATFGIGTFFTNDFERASNGQKSKPLNIVMKLSSAGGKPAIKISDNLGKNTGDTATVERVKREFGYHERDWREGDESKRWD
ncbi:MAG: hypothetical protein Q9162_006640 [Coniocarpon cinnabarinum]